MTYKLELKREIVFCYYKGFKVFKVSNFASAKHCYHQFNLQIMSYNVPLYNVLGGLCLCVHEHMCTDLCVSWGYFDKAVFTVGLRLFTVSLMITLLALQVPSL